MPQHHPAPAVVQRIQNSRYIRAFSVVCSAFMALIYLLRIPGMLGAFADAMKLFRVLLVFAVLACIGYVVVSTVTDVNTPVTDREVMKNGGFSLSRVKIRIQKRNPTQRRRNRIISSI